LAILGGAVTFHRAEVQDTLLKEMPERYRCHLSRRLVSHQETDKEVVMNFEDGSVATCDLLIGADGIKSVVRKGFILDKYPEEKGSIEPIFTGTTIYRGLYDSKILAEKMPDHRSLTKPMVVCSLLCVVVLSYYLFTTVSR
jgi:salicylate hydroxylase